MSIKEHPPQQEMTAGDEPTDNRPLHVPVLLDIALHTLNPQEGESYLDLTAGYGGHARRVLEATKNFAEATLVDRDAYAISHLASLQDKGARLMHSDFLSAARQLVEEGKSFDIVLVDLGVSSPQLDQGERGFSFLRSGPLDMRMDARQPVSAETLVNTASAAELARIIERYGEESRVFARQVADAIVSRRPLHTTADLAELVAETYRGPWRRIHPATRTFQALRIAVNDELRQIEQMLPLLPRLLNKGGRVGIISFHSLEDRLVKQFFKAEQEAGLEGELQSITKKPLDGATYDVHNPRSRSAKLRAAVKK